MGQSLSRSSQEILDAATQGDVACLLQQIESEPRLVKSVTLLKRRGILHLAAKEGHSQVLNAVLEPLIAALRLEYFAQQAQAARAPVQKGVQQQQQAVSTTHAERPLQFSSGQDTLQHHGAALPQQSAALQPELQLASFSKLRQAVNARDLYRRTPLIVAAKQGHLECTQILLESASNLFAVDREGNTCLHYAALHGHVAVVQYLMRKASDRNLAQRFVNKRNLSGFTPLHYAVWGCNEQLVQLILEAGSDVTAVNDRVFDAWVTVPVGSTPLHLAAMRNHLPVALMLLQHYVVQVIASPSEAPRLQDPRSMVNLYGMNPAQLAAHRSLRQLSRILSPSLPLSRVLEAFEPSGRRLYGPLSLKSIAAGVMQNVLDQQLKHLNKQLEAHQAADTHEAVLQGTVLAATISTGQAAHESACQFGCCAAGSAESTIGTCCGAASACAVKALSAGGSLLCSVDVLDSIRRTDSEEGDEAQVSAGNSARFACSTTDLEQLRADDCSKLGCSCADRNAQSCGAGSSGYDTAHISRSHQHSSMAYDSDCTSAIAHSKAATSWHDEQCCVCWEEELSVSVSPCSHALCLACARQLVANSAKAGATCPLCRSFIGAFELLPGTARPQRQLTSKTTSVQPRL